MNVRHDMVTVFVVRKMGDGAPFEFLQLRRVASDFMGGTWQIIRGGVDPGETYLQAALRELREEANIEPTEFYRLGSVESFYIDADDTLWHAVPFCAIVPANEHVAINEEHDEFRWVPLDQIEQQTMWASERSILRDLQRDILQDSPWKPHLRIDLSSRS